MELVPVWFDSLGAKSMCVLVRTPDLALLIDPGAAIMQPGYPAPDELKLYYLALAQLALHRAAAAATHIAITHYHYDHFRPDMPGLYQGKTLWVKDPNRWINRSQWNRAREFFAVLAEIEGWTLAEVPPEAGDYPDPVESLPLAARTERRKDLLKKWRKRFTGLVRIWAKGPWIDETSFEGRVTYADGRTFRVGEATVRFTHPLFHGVEYAGPGWVLGVVVEHGRKKLLYSSDLQGPTIEDYAAWIVEERPDVLILDGPATYLLGPFQSKANLERALANCASAVREARAKLTVLDHHLVREPAFRQKAKGAFSAGAVTGAELMGLPPLTDRLARWRTEGELNRILELAASRTLDLELLDPSAYAL
ncbi:MBL fold metallo-hydrolase [Candidatus Bipolaricaulota bacterium]|nr:MBL fold metallo-hydrolase [Candidatus Bipolaricaulota bacterium]